MADLQHVPPELQRRYLLEVIEDQQQKAWKKLRDAGVSEAQVLAVMPRIRAYCMYALNEYDQAYMVIEEMVARDGRSPEHDQFIADKGAFLLRQMEAGIAELVGFAIRGAIRDAETPPAPVQTVIPAVRYKSRPPDWQIFLSYVVKLVLWFLGMPASFLTTTLGGEYYSP